MALGMHIHFIAVAGTGMGALAGLFRSLGHDVSGSDVAFDPPMGPALERWGVRLMQGFDPAHLDPRPDLVVVGNVCRKDNPEARAAIDGGLHVTTMAHALADHALVETSPLVVAGTHGKTTTSALSAYLLDAVGLAPGFLIGGLPKNFETSFRAAAPHRKKLPLTSGAPLSPRRPPFVVEGDEYDTAFFEKTPKFWHYRPEVVILTSIEHDHVDIYPSEEAYLEAFRELVRRVPETGLIVAAAFDPKVVEVVRSCARAEVAWYALQGDETFGIAPEWLGAPGVVDFGLQELDLYVGGVACPRARLGLPGEHNVRNAIAAIAAAAQGYGARIDELLNALPGFQGVRRRQDLLGEPSGVRVYDDFAHHPTAVEETLRALRAKHPEGKLIAVFEPRSATACRKLHQEAYAHAFGPADRVLFPPLGRTNIPEAERLDLDRLVSELNQAGKRAEALASIDAIVERIVEEAASGDTVALLSNGAFGGIHQKLLEALRRR